MNSVRQVRLSRSTLFRLGCAVWIGLLLSACSGTLQVSTGHTPTSAALSSAVSSGTQATASTSTPEPSITSLSPTPPEPTNPVTPEPPTPTDTPSPTVTTKPSEITSAEWATVNGKVDPKTMYGLLGAVNRAHRHAIDAQYDGMALAVTVDVDTAETSDIKAYKERIVAGLNADPRLRDQLKGVKDSAASAGLKVDRIRVIIRNNQVTEAVDGINSEKYSVDPQGKLKPIRREQETPLLPKLEVTGDTIRRADTHQVVTLKGANLGVLNVSPHGTFPDLLRQGLKPIADNNWNFNILRVQINTAYVAHQLAALDQLLSYAERNGSYVWLVPASKGEVQPFLPPPETAQMMSDLAKRYKDKTNVLYGLFNEPAPWSAIGMETNDWGLHKERDAAVWRKAAQPIADAIRQVTDAIIVVPADDFYASEFVSYFANPMKANGSTANIIYDVHRYSHEDDPEVPKIIDFSSMQRFIETHKHPVIIGEFGGAFVHESKMFQTPRDIEYMQQVMDLVDKYPGQLHYTAWALDAWDGGGLLQPPDFTTLTNRGKAVLNNVNNQHPPTIFTR